jgi:Flp pilus assembly protein TadG
LADHATTALVSAKVGASAALSTTGGPSVVSATHPVPRNVVLNSPPATMLPPFTRSMFQSRLEENASTFLPLIDKPALFMFSRCTS